MPDAEVQSIREACERLLNDATFRDNARRLGDQVSHDAANSTVVAELEAAALVTSETPAGKDALLAGV